MLHKCYKLQIAKEDKKDEFYTQYKDIKKEISHYKDFLKNKIIYCNCDNENSNFVKFFIDNFQALKIKKLIATSYNKDSNGNLIQYDGKIIKKEKLKENGSFDSKECLNFLNDSNIVITNPPFSKFRNFIEILYQYNKDFLVIGNLNAIGYKKVFKYIKNNKLFLGINKSNMVFEVPNDYPLKSQRSCFIKNDKKFIEMANVRWFTNINHGKFPYLNLTTKYEDNFYPKYINYDAIEVHKTKLIPANYTEEMGVPITFIDKYNPEQFEIIGIDIKDFIVYKNNKKMYEIKKIGPKKWEITNNIRYNAKGHFYLKYEDFLKINPNTTRTPSFIDAKTKELYISLYKRIIIKKRN